MKLLLVNSNVDKSRKERTHEYTDDICSSHRGNGSYLAQRRRGAEEFLDMINRIDRIEKGRENED